MDPVFQLYLHLPLTFLSWTISNQLASYTDEVYHVTLSLSDAMDKQTSGLVEVTFDSRQI